MGSCVEVVRIYKYKEVHRRGRISSCDPIGETDCLYKFRTVAEYAVVDEIITKAHRFKKGQKCTPAPEVNWKGDPPKHPGAINIGWPDEKKEEHRESLDYYKKYWFIDDEAGGSGGPVWKTTKTIDRTMKGMGDVWWWPPGTSDYF
jgi:hypothetical protein